ncbi:MAG TPA: flagellar motor switch protein FliG [Firmicutes bacterium]|nr:flagellar motor switch protein FliG [Bacillota bacterium]
MDVQKAQLTGRQKAAIVLLSLSAEASAQILRFLDDEKIDQIAMEIANLKTVKPELRKAVVEEFYQLCLAQQYILQGGVDYARQILERALGAHKAVEVLGRIASVLGSVPFAFMKNMDPSQILGFLEAEKPQTIALVLAHLKPEMAAAVISGLPPELQTETAMRIALMDRTAPEVVREVEKVLERKMSSLGSERAQAVGGVKALVDVLNKVDRGTEKTILERLERDDPELADEVKKLMFVFEDIALLDDRTIQIILRDIDMKDLALALKAAGEEVQNRIFKNMSERAATMLKEDMEFMGPVRLRLVEEAQQRIVNMIRRLENAGEIVISRGGEDEVVV